MAAPCNHACRVVKQISSQSRSFLARNSLPYNRRSKLVLLRRFHNTDSRKGRETHFGFENVLEEEKEGKVHEVFENVAEKYDVMNDAMSVGIHRLWKDCFVRRLGPVPGTKLIDVAGGTGDIAFRCLDYSRSEDQSESYNSRDLDIDIPPEMQLYVDPTEGSPSQSANETSDHGSHGRIDQSAKRIQTHVTICDINQAMLDVGKKKALERGYVEGEDVTWLCGNAECLPLDDNTFDGYTIAFGIRNVTHIDKVLEEAYRVLKPGGRFMCLEFSRVENPVLRSLYDSYSFQVIPVLGQVIARDWNSYQYLVESIRQFPDQVTVAKDENGKITVSGNKCSCTAGKGFCQHQVALLYQLSHYQALGLSLVPEIVSSTSAPQKWHIPPRTHGFSTRPVTEVTFIKPTPPSESSATTPANKKVRKECGVKSKLYNPVNVPLSEVDLPSKLLPTMNPSVQWYQLWAGDRESTLVESNFGFVPKGSLLSYQEKPVAKDVPGPTPAAFDYPEIETGYYSFPLREKDLEIYSSLEVSSSLSSLYESDTRDQSKCPEWHHLRRHRITSSNFKSVTGRRGKFEELAQDFLRQRSNPTPAMSFGLDHEQEAAASYSMLFNVTVHPVGLVINPSAYHLACSPDRRVFDLDEEPKWGLLEVKCTTKDSLDELPYLKYVNGGYELRSSHKYYEQCMGQMGLTGCTWCDFFVWGQEMYHRERIYFNAHFFSMMKVKLDEFYFKFFLPAIVETKLA